MKAKDALARLKDLGDPEAARGALRFFKHPPEGADGTADVFLGVKAAPLRRLARELRDLPVAETLQLLQSTYHEARSLALLILGDAFARGGADLRATIYHLYLDNTRYVNNWDLVDVSAPGIVGAYLQDRSRAPLYTLARSAVLWERRIAVVATQHFIRGGDHADTLKLAALLLDDREDLMHKAVGWMLREVGKRDLAALEGFLREHHRRMPRTTLRYAIERFPEEKRQRYLKGQV
jgi:3-methyladenine DNA glycosylase AlkD